MKRRIFVAITIPGDLKEEIFRWEKKYLDLPAKWLSEKNLHITLIPPFYEDEGRIENIKEILRRFENSAGGEVELVFENVSFGPDPGNPRLIWATGKSPQKIIDLKNDLEKSLNMPESHRPFSLHLTLARFNPEDFRKFPIKELNGKVFWKGKAESLVLMESKLYEGGANYDILEKIRL